MLLDAQLNAPGASRLRCHSGLVDDGAPLATGRVTPGVTQPTQTRDPLGETTAATTEALAGGGL